MAKPTTTAFLVLDTETTGLDFRTNYPWEVAAQLITVDWDARSTTTVAVYQANILPLDARLFHLAHPRALEINGFDRRCPDGTEGRPIGVVADDLTRICAAVDGAVQLVGACPWFDDEMLRRWVFEPTHTPRPWHYHLVDVECLANGARAASARPPLMSSDDLSDYLDVALPAPDERHTAMGDVAWARRMFEAIYDLTPA